MNLLEDAKFDRISNAVAAGQTTVTSDVIDMAGYSACYFVVLLADVSDGAELQLQIQHGDESGGGDMDDTELYANYDAGASDADNKAIICEIVRPRKRYVRAKLTRASADAEVDAIFAIVHQAGDLPVTQSLDVLASAIEQFPSAS